MITVRRQIELETIFLIAITAGVSMFFVTYRNNYQPEFNIVSGIPSQAIETKVVSSKMTVSSQISPDGTKKLIMKKTENQDKSMTYDFSTADEDGANEKLIYTKVFDSSGNMTIPFNTWSPDNQYFFIQEGVGGNKSIFVFKANGDQFAEGEIYLDAADLFKNRDTGNNFDEATGWASETLIIINTEKPDGTKGPSYWFEVPSKAIIQLSTEF